MLIKIGKESCMDNFSKSIAKLLAEGKTLEECVKIAAQAAAKEAIESFARSEMTAHLGYSKSQRRPEGQGDARNGYYERTIATSFGPITVSVPRDRDGDFATAALPRYERRTEVISTAILKLYSSGMTDEEMRVIIESLYDAKVSRSYVSSVTDAVMEDVEAFRKRKLPSRLFCLYLDSTYLPLRRGTVQKEAVNLAMGVDAEGHRVVVGYSITPQESAEAYRELLLDFKERGLESVEVIVSDGLAGIDDAIDASFPNAKRQRCFVHLMRNVCAKVRVSDRKAAAEDFMAMSKQPTKADAEGLFAEFRAKWGGKYPKVDAWADKVSHLFTFYEFPAEVRGQIYTNNPIEGFNKQIKRICKKSIQFVTEESMDKKLVTMFLHYNEGVDRRKVRGWKTVVDLMRNKE